MPFSPDDPEFRRTERLASLFANRAFVTITAATGIGRIAFGEAAIQGAESTYHSAVTMTAFDLLSLADAIYATYDEAYPPMRAPPAPGGTTSATAAQTYGDQPDPLGIRKPPGG